MRKKPEIMAALDVGSSKVCCFIAVLEDDQRPRIIGIGQQSSKGLKAGNVTSIEDISVAILNAIHIAEQMAGHSVKKVVVNVSGAMPTSNLVDVEVPVAGQSVSDQDVRNVLEEGYSPTVNGVEYDVLHFLPVSFSLDGCAGIDDPRGMFGSKLGATIHSINGRLSPIQNLRACIESCYLTVEDMVVSGYASGLSTLVEDELDLGATVVDIGGGVTSIAVFENKTLLFADTVPLGGQHITNDIAAGLATSLGTAERIKTLYGSVLMSPTANREMIEIPEEEREESRAIAVGGDTSGFHSHQISKAQLTNIIRPRVEEILEHVRTKLERSGLFHSAGKRMVITGGSSQLTGLPELAEMMLDKKVRVGKPLRVGGLAEATDGSAFATCAGLLNYRAMPDKFSFSHKTLQRGFHTMGRGDGPFGGLWGRFQNWIQENF